MKEKIVVAPYTALAPIYDAVMHHVNYIKWARYVHALVEKYCPGARRLIDLSCGTASCCIQLAKMGYCISGMDASLPMIRAAKQKSRRKSRFFLCADMIHPPFRRCADVMISLYDSMNYLQRDQWLDCLDQSYHVLEPGGIFIFDVSTIFNSLSEFSYHQEEQTVNVGAYQRLSSFDAVSGVQTNYFEIKLDDRPDALYCETHRQTIRSLSEVEELIEQSLFIKIASLKDFTFQPATERCERVHYILRREP